MNAAKALGMIKSDDPDVIPALIATLASHNQLLLDNSIWSLGEYGPAAKDAVPRLLEKQLDHDHANVLAVTTLKALAKIGPAAREAVPALIQDTKDRYYNDDVWVALAAIGPDAAAAVPTLFEHVVKNRSGDRAMKTIAAIGPGAIPFLTGKLHGTQQEQALAAQCLAGPSHPSEGLPRSALNTWTARRSPRLPGKVRASCGRQDHRSHALRSGFACRPMGGGGRLDYRYAGRELELAVPRRLLALAGDAFTFDFKWADNPTDLKDLISLCTSGDTAPNRRFNYRCIWKR